MKRVLSLRPETEADIAAAHNGYLARFPTKAPLLLEAIDDALNLIEAQPASLCGPPKRFAAHQSQIVPFCSRLFGRDRF